MLTEGGNKLKVSKVKLLKPDYVFEVEQMESATANLIVLLKNMSDSDGSAVLADQDTEVEH